MQKAIPLTEGGCPHLEATSTLLGSTQILHSLASAFVQQSLFLFLQTNLTSLEEARFLFLGCLGQHRANEQKKEGMSYTAFESFLPESLTHPHLIRSLFVPLPNKTTKWKTVTLLRQCLG